MSEEAEGIGNEGFLIDADSALNENNEIEIRLFVRIGNKIETFYDAGLRPYFYAIVNGNIEEARKKLLGESFGEAQAKILNAENVKKENVENVLKLEFKNTNDLTAAREELASFPCIKERREYDIPFARRYLLDRQLRPMGNIEFSAHEINGKKYIDKIKSADSAEQPKFKIGSFDLETYTEGGHFSDAKRDPIIMASYADAEEAIVFTTKQHAHNEKDVIRCASEEEMIAALVNKLNEKNLDVIVTYNGDGFDFPYLKERAQKYGIKLNLGADGSEPAIKRHGMDNAVRIHGRQHLDAYALVRLLSRFADLNLVKYDIESVVQQLFGEHKEKIHYTEINEIWSSGKDFGKFIDYCREDSKAALRIAVEYLPLCIELCFLARQTLHDVSRSSSGNIVESLLIGESFLTNKLIPNRPADEIVEQRIMQSFVGGYVKEPIAGLHENLAVLDFRSLYPTVIISHNISPETLNCKHEECKERNSSPGGNWFCTKSEGFFGSILKRVLKQRMELRAEMKKHEKGTPSYMQLHAKQYALKIVLNSFYGYLAYARSRYYSRECAAAVTSWCRHYVQLTIKEAEEHGFAAIYGDTDSAFIKIPENKNEKDVQEFVKHMNDMLPGILQLEIEGFYTRGIFVTKRGEKEVEAAKKRYALIDGSGRLKIVGFEYVRRDWAVIAKKTQKEVIEAVLKEGNPQKAIEIVKEKIAWLRSGSVPKEELVTFTQIKKPLKSYEAIGPHTAAAQKAINRGKQLDVGSIIGYIITRAGKSISEKAELEEFVKQGDYDADYYITNQLLPAVIKIISEFGYTKEDLLQGGKQQTLSGWG